MKQQVVVIAMFACLLGGCSVTTQRQDEVLVRASGEAHFDKGVQARSAEQFQKRAMEHWQFAVMSENAYHKSDLFPVGIDQRSKLENCGDLIGNKQDILDREDPRKRLEEFRVVGVDGTTEPILKSTQWTEWKYDENFPTPSTWCKAVNEGIAFKVYERMQGNELQIAISFRGTVFSYGPNWRTNLRWFVQWPRTVQDGGTVVQNEIAQELAAKIIAAYPERARVKGGLALFATGHSLGGAFAQQLSYAFPPAKYSLEEYPSLKLRKVIVFNPSPVNGWYWVDRRIRERNAGGLEVSRVYQHGEALAYVRLGLSYIYPPSAGNCVDTICAAPRIEEVRYNRRFTGETNSARYESWKLLLSPVGNHSMRDLAAGLASAVDKIPVNYGPVPEAPR